MKSRQQATGVWQQCFGLSLPILVIYPKLQLLIQTLLYLDEKGIILHMKEIAAHLDGDVQSKQDFKLASECTRQERETQGPFSPNSLIFEKKVVWGPQSARLVGLHKRIRSPAPAFIIL